jgi:hypothetical protein
MIEPHLTPKQSANYLRKTADTLNFNQEHFKEIDKLAQYFEDMYSASNNNWEDFMTYLCSDPWAHQKNYKGR